MIDCVCAQSCPTLCNPMDYSLPGSSVHGDSSGKNPGGGCHALLQGIFPTQRLNPGLLQCRRILLPSKPPGKPLNTRIRDFKGGKEARLKEEAGGSRKGRRKGWPYHFEWQLTCLFQ